MNNKNTVQLVIISFLAIVILVFGVFLFIQSTPDSNDFLSNSIKTEVNQNDLDLPAPFSFVGTTIIPQANVDITAKILSRKRYYTGKESKLSPIDLALGWDVMSQDKILNEIKVRQGNRWYYWKTKHFPVSRRQIEINSANMHLIPENDSIKKKILNANKGQIIKLKGYLVRVVGKNWSWQSSLTRKDTGNHSCEVVFVKDFTIIY